jgi:hypothetical protein
MRLWVARLWRVVNLNQRYVLDKMTAPQFQTIELHEQAPTKPAPGAPCNRCGVCCAAEPCPVAFLFLFQRHGRCRALLWDDANKGYSCGMVLHPDCHSRLIPKFSRRWMGAFFTTRIAAGQGCDSSIEMCGPDIEIR